MVLDKKHVVDFNFAFNLHAVYHNFKLSKRTHPQKILNILQNMCDNTLSK